MSVIANKALVQRHFDNVLNACSLTAVDEICSDDVVFHGPAGIIRGKAPVKEWIVNVHRAFQEFQATVDLMIAEGDRVVVRSTVRGFHRRDFLEMKASERRLMLPMVLIFRIADHKITDLEGIYDSHQFVEELGTPAPLLNKL